MQEDYPTTLYMEQWWEKRQEDYTTSAAYSRRRVDFLDCVMWYTPSKYFCMQAETNPTCCSCDEAKVPHTPQ